MEQQEKWTVVSIWERKAALMKLADQLTSSDQCNWLDEVEKLLDKVHKDQSNAQYTHYVLKWKGPMQKNYDPLYSRHKQSMHRRWASDPD